MNVDPDPEITSALADVARGELLEALPELATTTHLEDFAAALPELYAGATRSLVFAGGETGEPMVVQDIVFFSPRRVHIAQRVPHDPDRALVSVSERTPSIGLILAEARDRLTRV